MNEESHEITVKTHPCHCGHIIRFLVTDGREPLTEKFRQALTNRNIFIVKKGQIICCPSCEKKITIP
ncbi:MAG: hypothetical protein A2Y82_04405 [Candidatus Buchananbacteria bacterium RBG_13_36_9]|uniref:Uncharacterized protein n=1 Tax=Candidatus Buchananbacteria bacterium RBG_13_36_9 TaxID=1797530 RepID=A0A1G1XR13_9BACT|nr:MAG: hypothetical protein A2Y82_04405 [Candidatus Buchananbacteria bacterium RBG_13_36_9]